MQKSAMNAFEAHLKKELNYLEFERLHEWVGITKTRKTQIINDPTSAKKEEVEAFAKVLEESPYALITMYHLGYSHITLDDMDNYRQAFSPIQKQGKP